MLMMWIGVAVIEFAFTAILSVLSLILLYLVFTNKPLKKFWASSPLLFWLFTAFSFWAMGTLAVAVEWTLVSVDLVAITTFSNALFLHFTAITCMCVQWFCDCATVGLFVQRNYFVKYPFQSRKFLNFLLVTTICVPCVLTAVFLFLNIVTVCGDIPPLNPECHSFNCMPTNTYTLRQFSNYAKLTFSTVVIVLGTLLQFLLHRHKSRFYNSNELKINKCANYLFFLKIVFEILPYMTDVVISNTVGRPLGVYIGPYAVLGASIDIFTFTLAYYLITTSTSTQMGNSASATIQNGLAISSHKDRRLYTLVDMHGGGELIPWMRFALNSGKYEEINKSIDEKIKEFMYNQGKGKMEAVSELVKRRNKERNAMLGALYRKKGKGKSGPNILEDFNQEGVNQGDLKKALKLLDGGGRGGQGESKYREIVWRLEERGSMGENLVGVCLLQATNVHNQLAMKLIETYPKLVGDVFISEEYYGLSPLHQAIVNEDPRMVNYLLQHGADVHQRCYGAFFCCEDQKSSRTDSLEHEYVELTTNTNYTGRMYFGEYPLAFAACTNQFDIYRLLRQKKADPNLKDTNGNTIIHLTVIHEKPEMLKFAYDTGGKLQITNNQNMTPLTLAAKLGKKQMFDQLLGLEGETIWVYGDASSTAYPLANIDTISEETGGLNENCALSYIVYGESQEHLALLEGLLEELLRAKWNHFARFQLIRSFSCFVIYYILFVTAFMLRPLDLTDDGIFDNQTGDFQYNNHTWFGSQQCHLWRYSIDGFSGYVRMVAEFLVVVLVAYQVIDEGLDIYRIGKTKWWQILKSFPAKILYKIALILICISVPLRMLCGLHDNIHIAENFFILVSVVLTTVHFLYYSRALKFVGPFVLMVYTIILQDMIRFVMIYAIFLMGFSQGFYLVFLACERERQEKGIEPNNILKDPHESLLRLFVMTIGEFTVFYRELNACQKDAYVMAIIGKVLFMLFELFVSIMLFNMLIAMMTRTYETIFRTQKEWKRQWAQVILMLELSLKPKDRMMALLRYSRPIGTNKRKRAFMVSKKIDVHDLSSEEKRLRALHAEKIRDEKRQLLKRRLKDYSLAMAKDGKRSVRPLTSYFMSPHHTKVRQLVVNCFGSYTRRERD